MTGPISTYRSRLLYTAATLAVVVAGLASRRFPGLFPIALDKYPGDALWALMMFFGLGIVLPHWLSQSRAAYALLISAVVEFSQLYQSTWINAIRATTAGHLVLGSTFSWGDILAYAVGIALGISAEALVYRLRSRHWQAGTAEIP